MPQISIIIPVYNVELYLQVCLDSVLAQSFQDFEIICINDGSTDGSDNILLDYEKKEPRLNVIRQTNQGLSNARNKGLKVAQGDYILFIDSDDAIHPQLLECTLFLAKKHLADMVSFKYSRNNKFLEGDKRLINLNELKTKITYNPLKHYRDKSRYSLRDYAWSKLYRKDFIGKTNFIEGINFEDIPFTYTLMKKNPTTVLLKEKLYFYRKNKQSITKNFNLQHITDRHAGLIVILKEYRHSADLNKIKHTMFRHLLEQYNAIKILDKKDQLNYWHAFQNELTELNSFGVINKDYIPFYFLIRFKILILQTKLRKLFNT